ncbi:/ tmk / Thymidylate kinase /:643573 Reverse [Candidatus Hepatoplasma crinochetorum]|uniref:Thymidylate kinase n=1 Tax=Candidatus Hepatoplasma crinochetorum TaxID=295596 RepID=A0A0G7ZNH2_9MOLU|nr:/ tmk / Thymidylate kinase /:643573 Reverse [Candidatus Hepatoplasma crinochetorum]
MKYQNFITIEGIDGAGKTTIIYELKKRFLDKKQNKYFFKNKEIIFTREPGNSGNDFLLKTRDLIVNYEILPITELFLLQANRAEHIQKFIFPFLKDNKIIICDRFIDSTFVYQGLKGIKDQDIIKTNKLATLGVNPKTTYLIDLDPKLAQERIKNNKRVINKFDQYDLDFHNKIRKRYLDLASKEKKRFVLIDGNKEISKIVEIIIRDLNKKF